MPDRSENVSHGTSCIPNMKSFPPVEAEKSVTKVFSPPAAALQSPYYYPDFHFVKSGQKSNKTDKVIDIRLSLITSK